MRTHLSHIRIAVMLIAAAVFLSGCYHMMSPRHWMPSLSHMDRMVRPDRMDKTDRPDSMDRMDRPDRSAAKSSWGVTKADRPGYTVAMVEKALRIYDAKGREATVAYFNSPQSVDGEWYVFVRQAAHHLTVH